MVTMPKRVKVPATALQLVVEEMGHGYIAGKCGYSNQAVSGWVKDGMCPPLVEEKARAVLKNLENRMPRATTQPAEIDDDDKPTATNANPFAATPISGNDIQIGAMVLAVVPPSKLEYLRGLLDAAKIKYSLLQGDTLIERH